MYTRLDGQVGPRAIDPTTVNAVDAGQGANPTSVARRLGAAFVITGSVVGNDSNVVVEAVMEDTARARRRVARAEGHREYATTAGDTTRALREFGRYLTLRAGPEPSVVPEVEMVRAAVARLEGGGS